MTDQTLAAVERKRPYLTLDGIRGVAALAVVSRHFAREIFPIDLPGAYLAVDIFFAMSGFVLALSYDDRIGRDLSAAQFLKKRLIRLYPLHLAGIVLVAIGVAAALAAHVPLHWGSAALTLSIVSSLVFLPTPPSLSPVPILFPLNGPAWSLFMEIAVNILYAAVRPWLASRVLTALLLASGLGLTLAIAWHGDADIGADWATLAIAPPRVLFSFFLGVALYRWDRAGRLPRIALPAWSVLLLVLLVFAGGFIGAARTMFDLAAVFLLLPLLLVAGIRNQPRHLRILCTFLGVTSYPIYVLHVPLQKYIGGGIDRMFGGDVAACAPYLGLAIVAAMLPIGWLANRFYDAPVRAALGRMLARRRPLDMQGV